MCNNKLFELPCKGLIQLTFIYLFIYLLTFLIVLIVYGTKLWDDK
jgi:hypothetical protein